MRSYWVVPLILFIGFALLLAGCLVTGDRSAPEDTSSTEGVEEDAGATDDGNKSGEDDDQTDLGDLEVWIGGDVTVEQDQITVEGKSNLLPGTVITSSGVGSMGHASVDFQDSAEVEADGTFYFEFPGRESNITVHLRLYASSQEIKDHYGEHLEKVTGPQVYLTETHGIYEVKATFYIDTNKDMPYTMPIEIPEWDDPPEDYGDPNVWMEVDVTSDHKYLYFTGKSNLLEGAQVGGNLRNASGGIEPYSYDYTQVNPDGSFELRVRYRSLREGMYMPITYDPDRNYWEDVIDAYGEEGEKLEGDLVQRADDGKHYAELKVVLDVPDLTPPEEVALTVEDDEIKIQVPDDLLFDFDDSQLKSNAKETLDGIIDDLQELADGTVIHINGHTDNVGDSDYNMDLSEQRAQSVWEYVKKHGDIDHLDIHIQGYGETKPIESNEDEKGRSQNRRVEIVINPQ